MQNAIIFLAYIPYPNRIQKYVDILSEYSKKHDVFISISYTEHSNKFLEALNKSNVKYQYVMFSKYCYDTLIKEGISLYLKNDKKYNVIHFISTNGINYSNDKFEIAFETNFSNYLKKLDFIENFLNKNPLCGSYSEYGNIKYEWYMSKDCKNLSSSLDDSSILYPLADWSKHYKFDYLPLRTQWSGSFTIRYSILKDFFNSVNITDLKMIESNMSQIVCRHGFIKHINNFYKPFSNRSIERLLIERWIEDNNLLISKEDLLNYFSS